MDARGEQNQKSLKSTGLKYDWPNVQIYKCLNNVLFLSKSIIKVFLGASTTGIQNDCMLCKI